MEFSHLPEALNYWVLPVSWIRVERTEHVVGYISWLYWK